MATGANDFRLSAASLPQSFTLPMILKPQYMILSRVKELVQTLKFNCGDHCRLLSSNFQLRDENGKKCCNIKTCHQFVFVTMIQYPWAFDMSNKFPQAKLICNAGLSQHSGICIKPPHLPWFCPYRLKCKPQLMDLWWNHKLLGEVGPARKDQAREGEGEGAGENQRQAKEQARSNVGSLDI